MGDSKDGKRRKERPSDDDENRKEKKSKRARTRSRSPEEARERVRRRKRRPSRSESPETPVKMEKKAEEAGVKKEVPERKKKETDMLNTRTGGAYIPPARLRMMQAQITDKSSAAYQRLAWEALKKSIHGHINKINVGNIGIIIKELLKENIVRGRGLLCRSVIQAQAASPTFTNVYAALVAAVNSRFPNIGELLLKRLVIQFKRGFKRNDKPICISSATFIAHLVNQRVAHEILALELLTLLVETPTDDSVEVSIAFLKECGQKLTEVSSKGVNAIFEMLRNILHEGQLDKRVQYMIEVMFQVWKDGFKDHPALIEELELVPEEDQFTHLMMLDEATDPQDILNVFKFDEKYEENEQKYKTLCKEILGSDAESGEEGSGESGSEESEEDDENDADGENKQKGVTIIDNTETNLIALRRTIYLTINSSLDFEECAHKLMKMTLRPGQEVELCHMFLDCCAEQRTYEKFYGLLAQRFCNINRMYIGPFEEIFKDSYATAHRLDTNRLRNVSKFFAHLLFTDSISWEVLECVRLNEEDTTSSSRIYIKILFQELAEYMGLKKLNDRLKDPTLQESFSGVFPRDNPKNTRFSINFFTSIGLGGLTDELREHLKQMPKNVPAPMEINIASESSSDSSSSSESDSSSESSDSSDLATETNKSKKKKDSKKKQKTDEQTEPKETDAQKDTERWGHDGFYDTYGKDARRNEQPRDDGFVRPRDVRQRDTNVRSRDGRQNDDRRRDDRNGDFRDDGRRNDNRNRIDDRRGNDSRRGDNERRDDKHRGDYESSRGDDRKRADDKHRGDVGREDNKSSRDDNRYRSDGRRDDERIRDNRNRCENIEESRRRDDNRNRGDDGSNDNINRSDGRRDDDKRRDNNRNRDEDRSNDNENRRKADDRNRDDGRRDDDESRRRDNNRNRGSDRGDDNENRKRDDNRNRSDNRRDDDESRRSDDRRRDNNRNRADDGRDDKGSRRRDDNRNRIDNMRREDIDKHDKRKESDGKNRDDKNDKAYSKNRRVDERRIERDDTEHRDRVDEREKAKDDSKRKDRRDESRPNDEYKSRRDENSNSSDEGEKKAKKRRKKDKKRSKKSSSDDSDSSSEEETRSRKKRREKEVDGDEWDIRRASSIRREVPARYWD